MRAREVQSCHRTPTCRSFWSSSRGAGVLPPQPAVDTVHAVGAHVLYLPPYSPDFNPIEQVFSKIKNELRSRELRTIPELENAFGESLDWITRMEALHYYQTRVTDERQNEN